MKSSISYVLLTLCILACSTAEEESHYSRYEGACPGTIDDMSRSYGKFIEKYFNDTTTGLFADCEVSYFDNVSGTTCDDKAKRCAEHVQEFMWDRCHWRLLYNIGSENSTLNTYLTNLADGAKVISILEAMKKDNHIYDFASKCGSWDWAGLGIMIVCAFFGSYILLWIVGGIMSLTKKGSKKDGDKKPEKPEKAEKAD